MTLVPFFYHLTILKKSTVVQLISSYLRWGGGVSLIMQIVFSPLDVSKSVMIDILWWFLVHANDITWGVTLNVCQGNSEAAPAGAGITTFLQQH